jgi:hypothetical protein
MAAAAMIESPDMDQRPSWADVRDKVVPIAIATGIEERLCLFMLSAPHCS